MSEQNKAIPRATLILKIEIPDVPIDDLVEVFKGDPEGGMFLDWVQEVADSECGVFLNLTTENGRIPGAHNGRIVGAAYKEVFHER